MAGGQAIEGEGVKRGVIHNVPPELLEFDVQDEHVLHESDRDRVEEVDEELVLSIMAIGVQEAIKVAVEGKGETRRYIVVDGRRRVVNALEANRRLKKLGEPEVVVPVVVVKGDEAKLAEVMIALNELRKPHSVMAKAEKAARMLDRVKDVNKVARAFGKEPQTIHIWVKLASMGAFAKKLADEGALAPSAIVKFADLAPGEQKEALEKFVAEAVASGVKPTATRAGAAAKGQRNGKSANESGLGPSKRLVRAILTRDELRDKLDPVVVKTIKWLFGELEARNIGGLTGVIEKLEEEQKEKAKAKVARAAARAKAQAKRAASGAEA